MPLAHVFGVRHFSPAAALHLSTFLEEIDPEVVLIEGPSDATDQLDHLGGSGAAPPVAVLAFTRARPVRSILYPLAEYSPEWVALRWALAKRRTLAFIDLPAAVFLQLHELEQEDERDLTQAYLDDPYDRIAKLAGELDHETWWERHFEHTVEVAAYRDAILEFGRGLRELRTDTPRRARETLVREAYMRRAIRAAAPDPDRAVVVCGAYHAPVLTDDLPAMTDAELDALPRADCVLTLMPYSYPRLSAQSGYGAGNHAPGYFQALFEEARAGRRDQLPARYLASVAQGLRAAGTVRSAAEVIEGVRLARGLASLAGSPAPALADLRDAAVTLLGHGERAPLAKPLFAVEIGTSIGRLPRGVSRTALQDDFHQLVELHKLDRHMKDEDQKLELDLRENRFVKGEDAAFLDRRRSTFLNRLVALGVPFARPERREQAGTSKEAWILRWTPESEVRLAECSLVADAIDMGAAIELASRLADAPDVGSATGVLLAAFRCELADALAAAVRRVQALTVDEAGFVPAAAGLTNLTEVVRYGDVRDVDPAPLRPVLAQLFLRACLLLPDAAHCDDAAQGDVRDAMDRIQEVAYLGEEGVDAARWTEALSALAARDSGNPFLAGYAAALLIERGRMTDEEIDAQVSRRLSPGTEASIGVGWFEGLVQRNRAALFLRRPLWTALERYVDALDDEAFRRALVYLRRAFGTFSQSEVRRVVSSIAEIWKGPAGPALAEQVEQKLDEKDLADLDGLDLV